MIFGPIKMLDQKIIANSEIECCTSTYPLSVGIEDCGCVGDTYDRREKMMRMVGPFEKK